MHWSSPPFRLLRRECNAAAPVTAWNAKIPWLRSRTASTSPRSSYGAGTISTPAPSAPARRSLLPSRRMFLRQPEANVDMGAAVERIRQQRRRRKARTASNLPKRKQRRITTKKGVARKVMRAAPTDRTRSSHGPFVRRASVSLLRSLADRCMLLL